MRTLCIAILVVFGVAVLLGFSMELNLRPAHALFGEAFWAAVWHFLSTKVWEFIKAAAKAALLAILAALVIKMMQKLESIHVIKNFLMYADNLKLDQYVGQAINKVFNKLGGDDETNVSALAAQADTTLNLSKKQLEELAEQGKIAKVRSFVFTANPPNIQPRGQARLTWNIQLESGIATAKLKNYEGSDPKVANSEQDVTFSGSDTVEPNKTSDYVLELTDPDTRAVIDSKCVFVEVSGTSGNRCNSRGDTGQGVYKYLTPTQEQKLLRGTLASVISQSTCGGGNPQVLRNMAIYNAAKTRGVNPNKIDPTSGNFYTDMYRLGNPFASADFQELALRDAAASIEAEANQAVNQELQSNGQKALRGEKNGITRTSATIAGAIEQHIAQAFRLSANAPEHPVASAVGSIIGQMIVQLIFNSQANARLIVDNAVCKAGTVTANDIYQGTTNDLNPSQTTGSYDIFVNGKDVDTVVQGSTATLTWVVQDTGDITSIEVSPLPANGGPKCKQGLANGECTVVAQNEGTITFTLTINSKIVGKVSKIANLVVEPAPPAPPPPALP